MLVLARRPQERIVFPNVGITVSVVRVKGQVARLGIEAPEDIKVLRGEIAPDDASTADFHPPLSAEFVHKLRNRLNTIMLTGEFLQVFIESGRTASVPAQLEELLNELQSLDDMLGEHESQDDAESDDAPFRVLIVEDQANERTLLANVLEMRGCEVATASDGVEAMEYLRTHDVPDFLLLDMSLPRCDGPELLRALRNDERLQNIKVFAVSGRSEKSSGVPIGPDGVDGWFRKPVNTKRLISSMHTASGA